MKITFNWGTGIVIVIIIFLATVFWRIQLATAIKINLVSKDYYPKELRFQEQIDREKNTNSRNLKAIVEHKAGEVTVLLPKEFEGTAVEGILHFYRPSDFEKDVIKKISLSDSLSQTIDVSKLEKGRFILKIYWESDSVPYYSEHELMI